MTQPTPTQAMKITLMGGVEQILRDAADHRTAFRELGVFFFSSTAAGDAWLFEMSGGDCVQLASGGQALELPIEENPETIEVNWSHTFALRDRRVEITAYADKTVAVLPDAPGKELQAAMKRLRKKFTKEQLEKVHLPHPEAPPTS